MILPLAIYSFPASFGLHFNEGQVGEQTHREVIFVCIHARYSFVSTFFCTIAFVLHATISYHVSDRMTLEIRREEPADLGDLFAIHQDAFQRDDEGHLVERLRTNPQFDPALSSVHQLCRSYLLNRGTSTASFSTSFTKWPLSFVALAEKKLVGHLLFTPVQVRYSASGRSIASLALAPVSIRTEYQRQGIGSQLIRYALNELRSRNVPSVIVLGHEDYYPRFGFLPAKNYRIRAPFPLKNENCFMVLELQPDAFPFTEDEGVVEYLPEFGL